MEHDDNAPEDCVFCAISTGMLPASLVYQDDDWLVVMDIHPIREGHVLVIPRRHVARIAELSQSAQQKLFALADAILRAQDAAGYAAGGGNLLLNDGVAANQHIPHLHLHCIPRRRGDTFGFGTRLLARTFGVFGFKAGRARLDGIAGVLAERVAADIR